MKAFNSLLHLIRELLKVQEKQLDVLLKLEPAALPVVEEEVWLSTHDVMKIFKRSERTLYSWRKGGDLRFKIKGRTCYYLKSDVFNRVNKER
ncbi:helix-turn-helix domain-containing protein [Pedobacter gandavensis]|uniref:helix-turn-helix transcriptional regulator n=1 Tax=Pedobacter gandavensis TaxID=2679963 RepID=UPI0029301BB5|nr:helix-turn-helix domain-containing protein [Pedobacter gandavensis]